MDQAPTDEKRKQFFLQRKGWLERLQLGYRGREPSEPYALSSAHVQGVLHEISGHNFSDLVVAARLRCARVPTTLDLGGVEITLGALSDHLQVTSACTLRRGSIVLPNGTQVRVAGDHVCFEGVMLRGVGTQDVVVEVARGGSLEMERCHVEGGRGAEGGAVVGNLHARQTSLSSKEGKGLIVHSGGRALLQQCSANLNKWCGVDVCGKGSTLQASDCHVDGNGWYGVSCTKGAHASLEHTSVNCSRGGHGIFLSSRSSAAAANSEANTNGGSSAGVGGESSIMLENSRCNGNGGHGWRAYGSGSIIAQASQATCNRWSNAYACHGGHISCLGDLPCDLDGQGVVSD